MPHDSGSLAGGNAGGIPVHIPCFDIVTVTEVVSVSVLRLVFNVPVKCSSGTGLLAF